MQKKRRTIGSQLETISGNLRHKINTGKLLLASGDGVFICGSFAAMKRATGYAVLSARAEDDVCTGLNLVESAILVVHHLQNNDLMSSNYIIAIDRLVSRHQVAMEEYATSVKAAIKEKDFDRKDIMYSRYLCSKDLVNFYRHKIKSKSNGIVEKR